MVAQQKTDWHRLLGLIFTDFFTGSAWSVEQEKDLSMKRQLLEISTVLNSLFDNYNLEGTPVSYTMKDFQRDYVRNHLGMLSPDEVLQRFSPDDRLKGLSPDEVLQRFSPDDRLKGLSPEEIKLYLKKLGENTEK